MNALRRYIRTRRQELKISQRELAELCDLPLGTLAGIESGRDVTAPRPATLEKLANGLKCSYPLLDGLVRGLDEEALTNLLRWEEDYTYRLFHAVMRSPNIPEAERMILVAKIRTLWQSHGEYEIVP
ncbi:MAG: helix-turn-helix transcriptional regulator [Candidatus Sericytochromatia bacterium]|nr:helix-turn-helix transcriptional regulator [Candidatus Sericytochromatia bacterium]